MGGQLHLSLTDSGGIRGRNGQAILLDHNNGNVTLAATGGQLFLGYSSTTTTVRLEKTMVGSNGSTNILGADGTLYYKGTNTDTRYLIKTSNPYVTTDLTGSAAYPRLVAANSGGSDPNWIRVGNASGNGLIPYANGVGNLGTSSWKFASVHANTFYGALSGNASTATKLQTARTIKLGGDLSGSATFDGSNNITLSAKVVLPDGTIAPGTMPAVVDTNQNMHIGNRISFHSSTETSSGGYISMPTDSNGEFLFYGNYDNSYVRADYFAGHGDWTNIEGWRSIQLSTYNGDGTRYTWSYDAWGNYHSPKSNNGYGTGIYFDANGNIRTKNTSNSAYWNMSHTDTGWVYMRVYLDGSQLTLDSNNVILTSRHNGGMRMNIGGYEAFKFYGYSWGSGITFKTHAYFQYNTGSVRFECRNYNNDAWVNIGALGWFTGSSKKWKRDICEAKKKGLDIVSRCQIKNYKHIEGLGDQTEQTGLIAEETPKEILSADGQMVDMYKMLSYAYKAIQELKEEVEELKAASA